MADFFTTMRSLRPTLCDDPERIFLVITKKDAITMSDETDAERRARIIGYFGRICREQNWDNPFTPERM